MVVNGWKIPCGSVVRALLLTSLKISRCGNNVADFNLSLSQSHRTLWQIKHVQPNGSRMERLNATAVVCCSSLPNGIQSIILGDRTSRDMISPAVPCVDVQMVFEFFVTFFGWGTKVLGAFFVKTKRSSAERKPRSSSSMLCAAVQRDQPPLSPAVDGWRCLERRE